MSTRTKQEYFQILRERYQDLLSKIERTRLIDEAVLNSGLHRKSIIRALSRARAPDGGPPKLGRRKKYSARCIELLKRLYRASDYICSDKLKVMFPVLLSQQKGVIDVELIQELLQISPASIDRYLRQYRGIERRRWNSRTRPGSRLFKKQIPLKSLGTTALRPGYLQADTVAHGGETMAGVFIFSLTMTDEKCGWTLNRGSWGKCAKSVLPEIEYIHSELPFDLVAMNVDNGSEFLNARVIEYANFLAKRKVIPFPMTRSRSYRKNDNCHVEQKNWTHVRQIFGYDRLDDKELLPLMNEIYRVQNLIQNYFIPQFKLKSKVRVGAKVKKTYDTPKTPYQRLLEDEHVTDAQKKKLRETYATLNYFDLQAEKEELLARFEQLKRELKLKKAGEVSHS